MLCSLPVHTLQTWLISHVHSNPVHDNGTDCQRTASWTIHCLLDILCFIYQSGEFTFYLSKLDLYLISFEKYKISLSWVLDRLLTSAVFTPTVSPQMSLNLHSHSELQLTSEVVSQMPKSSIIFNCIYMTKSSSCQSSKRLSNAKCRCEAQGG